MKFPWHKYEELPLGRRNTTQIFITNRCNMQCNGCFARNVMVDDKDMDLQEYFSAIKYAIERGVQQINLLGGEPFMHQEIYEMIRYNHYLRLKTTIYTNGTLLRNIDPVLLGGAKLRVSIYALEGPKGITNIKLDYDPRLKFDANFMVSANTTVQEMLQVAHIAEHDHNCPVFFIFSMRELENLDHEFFLDNEETGNVLDYKGLVHEFLSCYEGNMEIHVSKRGVFESTTTQPDCRCRFANTFIGGKHIQCPYDVVNLKYVENYSFGKRFCQHNNTCLMSKVVYRPK